MFRFGVLYLWRGRKARCLFESGVSILTRLYKEEIRAKRRRGAHPCSPDTVRKCIEQFKRPDLFACINRQIVSVPTELENPLRTAGMTLEDDYGMINGIINNGRRGEELEKAQAEVHRTTPEKKPSIRERLEDAKRECGSRKAPDKPAPQKKPPELGDL